MSAMAGRQARYSGRCRASRGRRSPRSSAGSRLVGPVRRGVRAFGCPRLEAWTSSPVNDRDWARLPSACRPTASARVPRLTAARPNPRRPAGTRQPPGCVSRMSFDESRDPGVFLMVPWERPRTGRTWALPRRRLGPADAARPACPHRPTGNGSRAGAAAPASRSPAAPGAVPRCRAAARRAPRRCEVVRTCARVPHPPPGAVIRCASVIRHASGRVRPTTAGPLVAR